MALPDGIQRRGLTLDEAAEYCGVSDKSLLRHGPHPTKIGTRRVWDRKLLDHWLDRLSGMEAPADPPADLKRRIRERGKKGAALHNTP